MSSDMFDLSLRPGQAPDLPDPDAPGVNVWREHDGSIAAYGGTTEGRHWVVFPGAGVFWFGRDDRTIRAEPEDGATLDVVHDTFRRSIVPLALQAQGREVLHASAVRGPEGVVAFCAVSETGKSTLAYGLSLRGYDLWADDAVAFQIDGSGAAALPLPFAIRLRPSSARHYGLDEPAQAVRTPEPAVLHTICVLESSVDGDDAQSVGRFDGGEAFPALLAHAYCFDLEDADRKRLMIETYLDLTRCVDVLRVRVRRGLDHLPPLLDAVERAALGSGRPA